MEGTIGEIRIFAANFAPKTWAFCQGQTMPINQYQALFSILGTNYGGNGTTTFQLPDLRGRVPVGVSYGKQGVPNVTLGLTGGETKHTLLTTEMPTHNHIVGSGASLTAPPPPFVLHASSAPPDSSDPVGNLLADETNASLSVYADGSSAVAPMGSNTITGTFTTVGSPAVTMQTAGGNIAHENMQPYIAMNYVICLLGVYPSRN
ncbi:phage tail protein [Mucilaginibacter sp. KACC 22063]|uniref:phage tail protein n=1 Tax=Mucilaginibacter sp. KACC 22063 TaxID=3025666 RepID=UPI0023660DB9|nr:tail fiber protein [Mucilaginibacter sp. KACC 22063]WDF53911.1 tail fiber protein [Mucilaginibacter sp. KACC 22063]